MQPDQETALRSFERKLDQHYKNLRLWAAPRPQAIYATLTVSESLLFALTSGLTPPLLDGVSAQHLKYCEEGISQGIQWLCPRRSAVHIESTPDIGVIDAAHQFALFGATYVLIADGHRMYGHGWATVKVDPERRIVTFDLVEGPGISDLLTSHDQVHEQCGRGTRFAAGMKSAEILRLRSAALSVTYRLEAGHVVLGPLPNDVAQRMEPLVSLTERGEILALSASADLVGFSVADYRSFCRALLAWSYVAILRSHACLEKGIPVNECMPIQIVDRRLFIRQTCALSRLPEHIVTQVLDRLTYRPSPKADILLSPFFSDSRQVCWSPAVFVTMRHERNLLKVMVRGPKELKHQADALIGGRSRRLAALIGRAFARYGYQYRLNADIASESESTDVDVVLYAVRRPEEVLLVEAKAILPPDEIHEVYDAHATFLGAQDQLRRAIRILKGMSLAEKRRKFRYVDWAKVTRIYGVVMPIEGDAHLTLDQREFPVVSYTTLRSRFRRCHLRSPERFWRTCMERPWLKHEIKEGTWTYSQHQVGDVIYRLPVREVEYRRAAMGLERRGALMRRGARRRRGPGD